MGRRTYSKMTCRYCGKRVGVNVIKQHERACLRRKRTQALVVETATTIRRFRDPDDGDVYWKRLPDSKRFRSPEEALVP